MGCSDIASSVGIGSTAKSAKSAESAAGADDESGMFIVLGLTKKNGGLGRL